MSISIVERDNRFAIIRLIHTPEISTKDLIERAKAILDFIEGKELTKSISAPPPVPAPPAPPAHAESLKAAIRKYKREQSNIPVENLNICQVVHLCVGTPLNRFYLNLKFSNGNGTIRWVDEQVYKYWKDNIEYIKSLVGE